MQGLQDLTGGSLMMSGVPVYVGFCAILKFLMISCWGAGTFKFATHVKCEVSRTKLHSLFTDMSVSWSAADEQDDGKRTFCYALYGVLVVMGAHPPSQEFYILLATLCSRGSGHRTARTNSFLIG